MMKRLPAPRGPFRGFTLVELVIVMGVVALLVAIVLPQYTESVARARRTDARATLALAAQWMERHRAENAGSYANAALPAAMAASPPSGRQMYRIELADLAATRYTLRAVPVGPMAADACGTLTQAQDGARTVAGETSGARFDRCWSR